MPPARRRHESGLDEPRAAGGVEGVVDADAVGQPMAFGDDIGLRRIDGVGRTEMGSRVAPFVVRVRDDDARRARDPCTLHHRDADAAESHHEHGCAFDDLGGVDDCADAGLQRATDDRREIERDVVVDADDTALGGHETFGEATHTEPSVDERAVARQRRRTIG